MKVADLIIVAALCMPPVTNAEAGKRATRVAQERPTTTRRSRRNKGRTIPTIPLKVSNNARKRGLKLRRRILPVLVIRSGDVVELQMQGPGLFIGTLYRKLKGGSAREANVDFFVDGELTKSARFLNDPLKGAKTRSESGEVERVSRPFTVRLPVEADVHTVRVQSAPDGAEVVMEALYFQDGFDRPAPITLELPPPTEVLSPAIEEETTLAERTFVVDDGRRDRVLGEYEKVVVSRDDTGETATLNLADDEVPFSFAADGPGTITVRAHRVVGADDPDTGSLTVSILENDVLLQSVVIETPLSDVWRASDKTKRLSAPREYKLKLGPKPSRFTFLLAEPKGQRLALSYGFEPADQETARAMLELGDDIGIDGNSMAGQTVLTEVDYQETVVERVVEIGGPANEVLGAAVGLGAGFPPWGGDPAPLASLELQWVLVPELALALEAQARRHALQVRVTDARGAPIGANSEVWSIPVHLGPVARFSLSERVRFSAGARGSFLFLSGSTRSGGSRRSGTESLFGAGAVGGAELRLGAGWWGLHAGYTWTPPVRIDDVVADFRPGGIELMTRFRFVL